jgi:hypothetical protein
MSRCQDGIAKLSRLALGFHWKSHPYKVPVLLFLLALDPVENDGEAP